MRTLEQIYYDAEREMPGDTFIGAERVVEEREKVKCPHGGKDTCIRPTSCSHNTYHYRNGACNGNSCDGNDKRQTGCRCLTYEENKRLEFVFDEGLFEL